MYETFGRTIIQIRPFVFLELIITHLRQWHSFTEALSLNFFSTKMKHESFNFDIHIVSRDSRVYQSILHK